MPESTPATPRKRILLLEDNADDAELLAIELEAAGIQVELQRVVSEQDFRHALGTFAPDVVVSDSNLPGFSGLQALGLVREASPGTPFVFLTGNSDDHPDTQACIQAGDGYLSKDEISAMPGLLARIKLA